MLTLIENGEIYAPASKGVKPVLLTENKVLKIGDIKRADVESLGIEFEVVDASGCLITPGFIDPHEHLLGGSGEKGFSSQTPEISATEIIAAGITTVVGCLGVDTTMKTMAGLLAKAKALKEEGLSAYLWTGGYDVPPTNIIGTPRNDIMFIEEIIGSGEIAVADERSTDHVPHELARVVIDTHNGGMLSRKAGVTHFHIGHAKQRLKSVRNILDNFPIEPEWIYLTHITRSEELMKEAIELADRGSFVDMDTVNADLPKWLRFYKDNGGNFEQLTFSTDASITSPKNLLEQIRICILEHKFSLEEILPCVTSNTAKVLKFEQKGEIAENKSADLLILEKDTLVIRDVICGGRHLLRDGSTTFKERFLKESDRAVNLQGEKPLKTVNNSNEKDS